MRKIGRFVVPVLICFSVGWTASCFQSAAMTEWYPFINKSSLTPPDIVFPIVWSLLYLCMGISAGLVLQTDRPARIGAMRLFVAQLFFNFTWSLVFFYWRSPGWGLVNILILAVLIAAYIVRAYRLSKAASTLFLPYLLWVCFAAYLNLFIVLYN